MTWDRQWYVNRRVTCNGYPDSESRFQFLEEYVECLEDDIIELISEIDYWKNKFNELSQNLTNAQQNPQAQPMSEMQSQRLGQF